MDLKNKTVVVTGAAQGLGAHIAVRLAKLGANLALIDLNEEKLGELTIKLDKSNIKTISYLANIANETEVERVFSSIQNDFGQIDSLINNAGIIRDQFLNKKNKEGMIESLSLANWQSVIDVNLTGVFLCARETSRIMLENNTSGIIVNISSISRAGNVGQSNYSAAKSGVAALTVTWAKELARHNIRVAAIAPGFIQTDMTASIKPNVLQHIESSIPLGRMGQPEEIAHAVQFILENNYFTGRILEVDGGLRI